MIEVLWSVAVGALTACGVYLMLERHVLRFVFGLILLSNAVNLSILVAGRLTRAIPPLVKEGQTTPPVDFANPIPQALILTAIVIGFGLLIFTLFFSIKANERLETADLDQYDLSERES